MSTNAQSVSAPTASSLSYLGGILLVSGACIGGGMLAMPIQTAEAGFFISFATLTISWGFMAFTGLLLVEATLWLKAQAHFSSLSEKLLGKGGRALSLVVYLFMNWLSLIAYTAGGAALLNQWTEQLTGVTLGHPLSCALFTLLFGFIICLGASLIGKINGLLTLFMIGAYSCLVGGALSQIEPGFLIFRPAWKSGAFSFPLILAAFSYQMIVPSLCSCLAYDAKKLKGAILYGTLIPFMIYALWLFVIHGIVPLEGATGLRQALIDGSSATTPLREHLGGKILYILTDSFAFCALVTSYLGLSLGLLDFIRDLFRNIWERPGRLSIAALSLIPSLILSIFFPRALIDCLDLSGGFGDALLSGMIPVAMIWIGRYKLKQTGEFQAPGGRLALVLTAGFFLSIFLMQCYKLIG
jgi:tyrosine-specific transport protein